MVRDADAERSRSGSAESAELPPITPPGKKTHARLSINLFPEDVQPLLDQDEEGEVDLDELAEALAAYNACKAARAGAGLVVAALPAELQEALRPLDAQASGCVPATELARAAHLYSQDSKQATISTRWATLLFMIIFVLGVATAMDMGLNAKHRGGPAAPESPTVAALRRMRLAGFAPARVLDVGARFGHWSMEVSDNVFPEAEYTLVEAIDYKEQWKKEHARFPNIKPVVRAIMNDQETEVLWHEKRNSGDSMFKENTHYFDDAHAITRKSTTLDRKFRGQTFDLVKFDVQGAELAVMRGGRELMQHVQVVCLELPFAGQFNAGAPSFAEYVQFMDELGFSPVEMVETHLIPRTPYMFQVDFIFARKGHPIHAIVQQHISRLGAAPAP